MAILLDNSKKSKPMVSFNIGACLDLPTCALVTGKNGETIINGGLTPFTGMIGYGNNFKSTIMFYMAMSALDKFYNASASSTLHVYDTEMTLSIDRLASLSSHLENIDEVTDYGDDPRFSLTDKGKYYADEWEKLIDESAKAKSKGKNIVLECFKDPHTGKSLEILPPDFIGIDSLTELEASSSIDMLDRNGADDSATNTYYMKQGIYKAKLLGKIHRLSETGGFRFLMSAQLGSGIDMSSGPSKYSAPSKKLQHMKADEKIKGVTDKFIFLTNITWQANNSRVLRNQGTGLAEYPKTPEDKHDKELILVPLTILRNKAGTSGAIVEVLVSQYEGVLPSLTEFHNIKSNKFGLDGNDRSYNLYIYPDVKLSRTTVRSKIDSDPKLRRALNITSELLQLDKYQPQLRSLGLMCTPQELYEDIKALGYDWDVLLETRGYWVPDQYSNKVPFLSTVDLLKMRKGTYKPYWLKDKKEGK